jgi:hypothetical protein
MPKGGDDFKSLDIASSGLMGTRFRHLGFTLIYALSLTLSGCSSQPRNYFGFYVFGAEVEVFSPCGSQKNYWVLTTGPLWTLLTDTHQALVTEPYGGIYVEVEGYYAGLPDEDRDGAFAAQSDGLFRITEVRAMRRIMASDCK